MSTSQPTQSAQSAQSTQPVRSTQSTQPVQSTQSTQPSTQSTQPMQSAQPTQPTQSSQPTQSTPALRSLGLADLAPQQKPDFILDLDPGKIPPPKPTPEQPNPKPLQRGLWCIRRYEAAELEWKASSQNPNAPFPYGIISYGWGPFHNKALKALGCVAGEVLIEPTQPNPNPTDPPMQHPTFDIGSSTMDSENGPDLPNKTFGIDAASGKRLIPKGTPLTWVFPVLRAKQTPDDPASAPFTISQIYKALKAMNQRFVWWDWACFPQGWEKDFWTNKDSPAEFRVHAELVPQQNRAFNNLRYFYPNSTVGCLWWHQSIWDPLIQPKYYPDSMKAAGVVDSKIKPQDGPGNRDYNAVQRVINNVLDMVDRDPNVAAGKPELVTPAEVVANTTHGGIFQLINNLITARGYEGSLRSLWSFQEGVLFTSSRRPLQSLSQSGQDTAVNQALVNPSVILDRYGNDLKVADANSTNNTIKALAKIFPYTNVNLVDITFLATLIAGTLADGLISRVYAPDDWRYWEGKVPASVPDYYTNFVAWCADKTNDGPARLLLSKLINTGLVGYDYDSPLTLLEAKFGRNWEPYQSDMDVFINTVMGSLEIDFQAQLNIGTAAVEAVKKYFPNEWQRRAPQIELDLAKPNFLRALVDLYQWRFLLFARGDDFRAPAEPGFTAPFWDSLIGKERPAFAPLHLYLVGRDKEMSEVFGPNRKIDNATKQPVPSPTLLPGIPKLSLPNLKVPAIRIEANPNYTIYEFPASMKNGGWQDSLCYQYVKPGAVMFEITPGATVETLGLPFSERAKLIPSTGDIALIPLKKGIAVAGMNKKVDIEKGNITGPMTPARVKVSNAPSPTAAIPNIPGALPNVPTATVSQEWTTCAIIVKYRKPDPQTNPPPITPVLCTGVFWGMGDFKLLEASQGDAKLVNDIYMY